MRLKQLILNLLLFAVASSAFAQPYYIGQQTTTLTDASRSNRQIAVEIFYPATSAGNGTPIASSSELFPLIVFGHGFSMTVDAYSNFWNEFVPQGYIIVLPKTETGPIPFPSHGEFANDLNFIIGHFQAQNTNAGSPYFGKISDKTAMMGHSMGGGCTFLAGGSNPNITTVVGFAPAETNPSAIAAAGNITMPTLVFIGSKDAVAGASGNATPMYNALSSSCKAYVTITDGGHCEFAESNLLCNLGQGTACIGCTFLPRAQHHALTFQFLNPWLRFFLKGECAQWDVFQNLLPATSGITYQQDCNYNLPVADFSTSGSTSFCLGGSVSFTANGNYDYLWSTNETTSGITVLQGGDYSLVVTDNYNCKDTSAITIVDVYLNPSPLLRANSDLELCVGEVNELFLDEVFASYNWNDGSTDSTLTVSEEGEYFVAVIDLQGCAGVSDTLLVEVNSLPAAPVIELRSNTLFAVSGNGSFHWYRNDTLLVGVNDSFLIPASDGNYSLMVEESNGCSALSESIAVTFTSSVALVESEIHIFPNPTNGMFIVSGNAGQFRLFDKLGREVMRSNDSEINISGLQAGVYFLKAENQKKVSFFRVIKY